MGEYWGEHSLIISSLEATWSKLYTISWPISFVDLQVQDETYYESLRHLSEMHDVSSMSLDFTVTEEIMGLRTELELVKGGATRELTNENVAEYLEANLRYRMLDRTKLQLTELLLGFFDVVPASALTVFDPNELELILCGLSEIDMVDWQAHTNYSGIYQDSGSSAKVVEWFWQGTFVAIRDRNLGCPFERLFVKTEPSPAPANSYTSTQEIKLEPVIKTETAPAPAITSSDQAEASIPTEPVINGSNLNRTVTVRRKVAKRTNLVYCAATNAIATKYLGSVVAVASS
jgi:hypothetical protein